MAYACMLACLPSRLLCRLDRGGVEMLRKLMEIDVPDSDNAEGKGDMLDAMVVGLHATRQRTFKK